MMSGMYHRDVRTTLTLDEDVAEKLRAEVRRTGHSFKEVVNSLLRIGLLARTTGESPPPFRIEARPLGRRPGLDYDRVSELIEQVEGPFHR